MPGWVLLREWTIEKGGKTVLRKAGFTASHEKITYKHYVDGLGPCGSYLGKERWQCIKPLRKSREQWKGKCPLTFSPKLST